MLPTYLTPQAIAEFQELFDNDISKEDAIIKAQKLLSWFSTVCEPIVITKGVR